VTDRNVEALRPVYDAWGSGNWAAELEVYGPEMEWEWSDEFLDIGGVARDPSDASDRLRVFMSQWEDWRAEAERYIPAGDKVVVFLRYSGRGKGSGAEITSEGAHVWTMRDGKATKLKVFSSRSRALESAGLPPDA
jgi:ketosteroid isomerase-like protein